MFVDHPPRPSTLNAITLSRVRTPWFESNIQQHKVEKKHTFP